MLYAVVAGDDDSAIDRLALLRDADDYRSSWLVEAELPGWEHTLVRHWLYDTAEELRWELVSGSTVPGLAAAAERAGRGGSAVPRGGRGERSGQSGRSPVARAVDPVSVQAAMDRWAIRIWCTSSAPSAKRAQRACWNMCARGVSVE